MNASQLPPDEQRIRALIVKVGEEKKKIPGNLKGLSIGLEEDIVPHKQVMQDTVMECVTYLPQKTSVYAAWLGLLVRPHRVFVTELVDRAAGLLGECSTVLSMKILMRFLVELANCRCVLFETVLGAMQELMDLRKSEDIHNKEMPVYIALHGLLVVSAELYKENKAAIDGMIAEGEKMTEERAERRTKLAASTAAFREHSGKDDFDRLVEAVKSMRDEVWSKSDNTDGSPVLLRPYAMSGLGSKLAVNQPEHMLEIPNIEWRLDRLDSLPRSFPFRLPLTASKTDTEPPVDTDGFIKRLSVHDGYILDTLFDEIMTAFDKHVGECAKQLLKLPVMSGDFLPRLVDSMFNRLVQPYPCDRIQEPPKLFFTRLIDSVMALQSSTKPLIEEAVKMMIAGEKPLVDDDADIRTQMALADFFAIHLISTDYKWEFDMDENSPTRQSPKVIGAGLAALLRLSFYQNLVTRLPESVHPLIPAEPRVNNKYAQNPTPLYTEMTELVRVKDADESAVLDKLSGVIVTGKASAAEAIEEFMYALLQAGSRTPTHMTRVLELHSQVLPLTRPADATEAREYDMTIAGSVFEFFRYYPVRLACTFGALLDHDLVTATAVAQYMLLRAQGDLREVLSDYCAREVLLELIPRSRRKVEALRASVLGLEASVQEGNPSLEDAKSRLEIAQQSLTEVMNAMVSSLVSAYNVLDVDESYDDLRQTLVDMLLDICRTNLDLVASLKSMNSNAPAEMKAVVSNVEVLA